jgi:hypothetical protein
LPGSKSCFANFDRTLPAPSLVSVLARDPEEIAGKVEILGTTVVLQQAQGNLAAGAQDLSAAKHAALHRAGPWRPDEQMA